MNECQTCKVQDDCIAVSNIWNGSDVIEKGRDWVEGLESCQIREIQFNINMKDMWEKSDYSGQAVLREVLFERRKYGEE